MSSTDYRIIELDVRPHLSKKIEPFQLIMSTVKGLDPMDVFVLHTPFKPTPLLGILKMRGYSHTSERINAEHWCTTFVHRKNKTWSKDVTFNNAEVLNLEEASSGCTGEPESTKFTYSSDETTLSPTITLDNRGLEPPQPMMRTLAALKRCEPGQMVLIHNDRVPVFLMEELNNLGCSYTVEDQVDGTAKLRIVKG
ncbi:DUF2249 domain-containing protein [Paenibacillus xylanilyticus]|uniref:DUF2249 domain-containing protein n=1 Tax=Paenibacillus xylanilyticus TaxID=248903 RepID=UPI0039A26128